MHEVLKCYDLMIRVQKKVIMRLNLERFSSLFPLEILRFLTPSFEKLLNLWKNIWSEIFLSEFFNRAGSAARDQKSELIAFCPFWVEVKDGPKSESGRSKRGKAYGHKN